MIFDISLIYQNVCASTLFHIVYQTHSHITFGYFIIKKDNTNEAYVLQITPSFPQTN